MRVLIVDDSIIVRGMVKALIESLDGFSVAGEASNGKKAIEMVRELHPDIVLMDINMPEMDGIQATGIIMETTPLPIIIFTSEDVAEVGYKALNRGAMEIIPKPDINQMNNQEFRHEFENILKHVVKFGQFKINLSTTSVNNFKSDHFSKEGLTPVKSSEFNKQFNLVVIGASTGGPTAVRTVLSGLPADFSSPIIITQHIEIGFDKGYSEWLNDASPLYVRIARKHDQLKSGEVLIAPATHHLVCRNGEVFWDDGSRINNQKPSVDKMFTSASQSYGNTLIGILLTGMGRDGAKGCKNIISNGGKTLVQDKESSMIYGMPKAAIELQAASKILPLKDISRVLTREVRA